MREGGQVTTSYITSRIRKIAKKNIFSLKKPNLHNLAKLANLCKFFIKKRVDMVMAKKGSYPCGSTTNKTVTFYANYERGDIPQQQNHSFVARRPRELRNYITSDYKHYHLSAE